jgi:NAD(P)-dependent dehydrogenase (short-subunit alcohol dehydrogenase family)
MVQVFVTDRSDPQVLEPLAMHGTVVLITGATRGLGVEVARQLAERGATVLVSGRDAARASATAAELAPAGDLRALPVDLDVTDGASVQAAADALRDEPGRLDVLINNAAAYVDWGETASAADLEASRRVIDANLFGPWRMTQALLPLLRESAHPRVVNVSSGAGSHGDDRFGLTRRGGAAASYGISKAAQNALTSTLAAELAGTPVLVNAACPGLTATWPGAEEMGARPIADGAASIVWAATVPDDGPSGGLFRDGRPLAW